MSEEQRPKVIPSQEQVEEAKEEAKRIQFEENEEERVVLNSEVVDAINKANEHGSIISEQIEVEHKISQIEVSEEQKPQIQAMNTAEEEMRSQREDELKRIARGEKIVRPEYAVEGTVSYGEVEYGSNTPTQEPPRKNPPVNPPYNGGGNNGGNNNNGNEKGGGTGDPPNNPPSRPSIPSNVPYDLIPLPSEGKIYQSKKTALKIAYMTAADENILTNPNLLESGKFLEVLFDRKIMDDELSYKDLHVGDRNAIMLWLRATGYGEIYPVELLDPANGELFNADIDLSKLAIKKLKAEPNEEGFFDFTLPISKVPIKFRLLTVGDVEEIEEHVHKMQEEYGDEYSDAITYTLEKHIVEVNGSRARDYIREFAYSMRIMDSRKLREYIETIESGIDLTVTIKTPGGESITTGFPLNINFFWPEL